MVQPYHKGQTGAVKAQAWPQDVFRKVITMYTPILNVLLV